MQKIGVVVDSTCYLTKEETTDFDIRVVSLNVSIDSVSKKEIDLESRYIIDSVYEGKKVLTSQPAPSEFVSVYNDLIEEGFTHILCFPLSKGLSGTYQSALLAKDMMETDVVIDVIDSNVCAYGLENIVIRVCEAINEKQSYETIKNRIDVMVEHAHVYFTLSDLDFVVRGGRVSKTSAIVGNLLRIKPIIEMIEGKLVVTKKMRTIKRIFHDITNRLEEITSKCNKVYIRLIQLNNEEIETLLEQEIKERFNNVVITKNKEMGPVFSYHLGENGFGITWTAE